MNVDGHGMGCAGGWRLQPAILLLQATDGPVKRGVAALQALTHFAAFFFELVDFTHQCAFTLFCPDNLD